MRCTLDKTYSESWCKIIDCYDSLSYYTTWTFNLEKISSLRQNQQEALTYGWDPKVVIYLYRLGHYWRRLVATGILNKDTMITRGIETMCPIWWSKGHVIMKYAAAVIPLVEFDICSLELDYVSWSHNKWGLFIKDWRSNLDKWKHYFVKLWTPLHREFAYSG